MQQKVINVLFWCFTIFFFLGGMHIYLPTQELNLPNFALPSNLITLSFVSVISCLALWQMAVKKSLVIPQTIYFLSIALILSVAIYLYHYFVSENSYITPVIGLLYVTILYIALHQFNFSEKNKNILFLLIIFSGLIEAILSISSMYGVQIFPFNNFSLTGNFSSPILLCSYVTITFLITMWLCDTLAIKNIIKLPITAVSFALAITPICYSENILSINILCISLSLYVIYLVIQSVKNNLWSILLSVIFISISIYVGSLFTIEAHPSISLFQPSVEIFKENIIFGSGFDTYNSQLLNLYSAKPVLKSYFLAEPENLILLALTEGGILGATIIALIFLATIKNILNTQRAIATSIGLLTLIVPFLILSVKNNPFDNSFVFILVFVIITWYSSVYKIEKRTEITIKHHFLTAQLAWIIPTLTLTFSISGILSLPIIHKELSTETFSSEQEGKILLFNPFVRYSDYQLNSTISAAKIALNTGIIYYSLEAKENLDTLSKYSTNPNLYKIMYEINLILNEHKGKLDVNYNFYNDAQKAKRKYNLVKE